MTEHELLIEEISRSCDQDSSVSDLSVTSALFEKAFLAMRPQHTDQHLTDLVTLKTHWL